LDKTLRELGELAGELQYPPVTMALRHCAKRLETDATLARKIKRLSECCLLKDVTLFWVFQVLRATEG
jgi:hypothetical protein